MADLHVAVHLVIYWILQVKHICPIAPYIQWSWWYLWNAQLLGNSFHSDRADVIVDILSFGRAFIGSKHLEVVVLTCTMSHAVVEVVLGCLVVVFWLPTQLGVGVQYLVLFKGKIWCNKRRLAGCRIVVLEVKVIRIVLIFLRFKLFELTRWLCWRISKSEGWTKAATDVTIKHTRVIYDIDTAALATHAKASFERDVGFRLMICHAFLISSCLACA